MDGDILAYECGSLKKKAPAKGEEEICPDVPEGDLLPFEMCWSVVQNKIANILKAVKADEYIIYLSSPKIKTWRYEAATIVPYKATREGKEKPAYHELIRQNLELHYNCEVVEFIEADDAMSIAQYEDLEVHYRESRSDRAGGQQTPHLPSTVICTRDKDLSMVPGWHYSWPAGKSKEKELWWQDEIGGLRCFYSQLLTGDSVDNILGLFGVGAKSALLGKLRDMETEREMFNHVLKCYRDRFGSYAEKFMCENGQLLWMQRHRDERWNPWESGQVEEWNEQT